MRNYKNLLSIKTADDTMNRMAQLCEIQDQGKSQIARRAIRQYMSSPNVVRALEENAPVDFLCSSSG